MQSAKLDGNLVRLVRAKSVDTAGLSLDKPSFESIGARGAINSSLQAVRSVHRTRAKRFQAENLIDSSCKEGVLCRPRYI